MTDKQVRNNNHGHCLAMLAQFTDNHVSLFRFSTTTMSPELDYGKFCLVILKHETANNLKHVQFFKISISTVINLRGWTMNSVIL